MAYAILRTEKLKTMGNIGGSLAHTYRTRETPNAVSEREHLNQHDMASADEVKAAIVARLPEKRRSDAVLCVEYFIGASPDYFTGDDPKGERYFATAVEWLKQRHGAENVVATSVHHDETSPHLVAYVVPLDDQGKLNAKAFLGGRAKLAAMQTDFAQAVSGHGLERGIEGSKATHQSLKKYYAAIAQGTREMGTITPQSVEPRVIEKAGWGDKLRGRGDLVEDSGMIAERLTKAINKGFAGTVAKASESAQNERKAKEAQDTAKGLKKRLEALEGPFKGLTKEQVTQVLKMAMTFQQENAKAKEQSKSKTVTKDRGLSL